MRMLWALGMALATAAPAAAQNHLVLITGLSGEAKYARSFQEWGATLVDAARGPWGLPDGNVIYLAEQPDQDVTRISGRSSRENVVRTLEELAKRAAPGELIIIVLIGHGSVRDGTARFNLPGPDVTAADFARLLDRFTSQKIVFVNASSASGDFIRALKGKDRTIITATRSGNERNETLFAGYFVEAVTGAGSDIDKDGRVSVLEAFQYARREVVRAYESKNLLLTEHALLDDDGDGEGSGEPQADGPDGQLASSLYLTDARRAALPGKEATDPRLTALYQEKQQLEEQVAALRRRKAELEPANYERELEQLLVKLALTTREIRELEEKQ